MYGNYNTGYNPTQYTQMPQNRMNQIEQQYGVGMYQPNNFQMQGNQQQFGSVLKGRPVSSYDEAKASMIDLDGSLFVFTDIANNCIYTKQILLDGTAELKTYVLQEQKQNINKTENKGSKTNEYVLKSDFDKMVKTLKGQINELKEGLSYDATSDKSDVKK